MERGSYISASSGLHQLRKLEIVNNNLANINTPGFKKQLLVTEQQSFDSTLAAAVAQNDPFARPDSDRTPAAVSSKSYTDFTLGPIKSTGNPLDVALRNPNHFFVVAGRDGGERYTRAGNFTLSEGGDIVTQEGMSVAGDGGAITVGAAPISITPSGGVLSGGTVVGRLRVVNIQDPSQLERGEGTTFKALGNLAVEDVEAEVVSGSLEMSNVSAITGVIDLITSQRAFEMYTRTAQSIDQLNMMSISQYGRPRV
jgi:flagellar basal-body rod protein FlgG